MLFLILECGRTTMTSHGVIGIVFVTVMLKLLHVAPIMALGLGSNDGNADESWVETLSWTPRAFLYHNFLSGEEADYIINAARPFLKRSTVAGGRGAFVDEVRSSYGMFLPRLMDPVLTSIEERVARWTHLNVSHQEDVQVLRYGYMQQYKAHYDSLFRDGPRIATVLMYLSDVEEGGETAFPSESIWLDESQARSMGPFSECAESHVAVKPRKGDALLFFSVNPSGNPDEASVHTGCPVLKGIKWTATVWIHSNPFRIDELGKIDPPSFLPEDCLNVYSDCEAWAAAGECTNNLDFMIGNVHLGYCRRACNACEVCKDGDRDCLNRNRIRAGYLSLDEL